MGRAAGSTGAWPFAAGMFAGAAAAAAWRALSRPRRLDPRLLRALSRQAVAAPVVFVPGLLGSELVHPDGTVAWLNLGNVVGHHDLGLPRRLPFASARDDLHPGLLVGTDTILPRAFGFTEYADVLELLDSAGFEPGVGPGVRYAVFTYDWRRDLVESARELGRRLDGLARAWGDPGARFHLVGHSMGGLVVRYYLRFGGAEPDGSVKWAGARRVASALLVATPNAGSIPALEAILGGQRVGLSHTTLAASVVARMPSMYQLLPPAGTGPLVTATGTRLRADLHDPLTWQRFGWGPFAPASDDRRASERAFAAAALERARAFHEALARRPDQRCPVPVYAIGGDCLPTLARAIAGEGPPGHPPRLEARTRREGDFLYEAGDGRVTRASLLATHLGGARDAETGSGLPEITRAFFGGSDHHGLYSDPAFQSLILRLLVRPAVAVQATPSTPPAAGGPAAPSIPTAEGKTHRGPRH
jgi:hypothetical protein